MAAGGRADMTAAELAELYLKQFDFTYEEHVLSYGPYALTIWEKWISDDPERAWPVFTEILARRRDDEILAQVGYRLRLLIARHWDDFHERAEELVRDTPRFARIVGDDFFEPPREIPLDLDELVEAYLLMTHHAHDAHRVRDVVQADLARGLSLAVEIIHRGPRHGFGSFDTFDTVRDVLEAHGAAVIDAVEEIAATSVLVRRCLWRLKPGENARRPREGAAAEVWRRAIAAHGTSTDYTDDDAPLPESRTLPDEDEALIRAWFGYQENLAAFEAMRSLDAETLWTIILRLLDRAEGQTIFNIAAGPLEDLLAGQGLQFIDRLAEEAPRNEKLRTAMTGVWLNEGDEVYSRFTALLQELNLDAT